VGAVAFLLLRLQWGAGWLWLVVAAPQGTTEKILAVLSARFCLEKVWWEEEKTSL
jgi:hypothetical protein